MIHPCTSLLYCLPLCVVLFSCAMDFNYRRFFSTLKFSWKRAAHTNKVPSLTTASVVTSYFSATLRSQSRCLPACLPVWSVPLLLSSVCWWVWKPVSCTPELSQRAYRMPTCVCLCAVQVHEHQMVFFHHEQKGFFSSRRFLKFRHCSWTLSLKICSISLKE